MLPFIPDTGVELDSQNELSSDDISDTENDVGRYDDLEQSELFIDPDLIKFSISSWCNNFKDIMPITYLLEVPYEVVKLFRSNDHVLDVVNNSSLDQFSLSLKTAIRTVGGCAFIKNNWHAPKDAAMFSLNYLLKVSDSCDALSYMAYSDKIVKDFDKKLGTMPFCVSIRPWTDIHPASEFRCIVVHNELVGITPREWPKYYAHYKDMKETLIDSVNQFFKSNIKNVFPEENYIFDIVHTNNDCILWDFSPLTESTKLHAFMWKEIKNLIGAPERNRVPVFRYMAEDSGIMPNNVAYVQY